MQYSPSQHAFDVLQCHDSDLVLDYGLLFNCQGHKCSLFLIVIVDSRHKTVHVRSWFKRSCLSCYAGEVDCTLSSIIASWFELLRNENLIVIRRIGYTGMFLDNADFGFDVINSFEDLLKHSGILKLIWACHHNTCAWCCRSGARLFGMPLRGLMKVAALDIQSEYLLLTRLLGE